MHMHQNKIQCLPQGMFPLVNIVECLGPVFPQHCLRRFFVYFSLPSLPGMEKKIYHKCVNPAREKQQNVENCTIFIEGLFNM